MSCDLVALNTQQILLLHWTNIIYLNWNISCVLQIVIYWWSLRGRRCIWTPCGSTKLHLRSLKTTQWWPLTLKTDIATHWSATGGLSVSSRSWCSSSLLNKVESRCQPLVPAPCIWTTTHTQTHTYTGSKVNMGKHLGEFQRVRRTMAPSQKSLMILWPFLTWYMALVGLSRLYILFFMN